MNRTIEMLNTLGSSIEVDLKRGAAALKALNAILGGMSYICKDGKYVQVNSAYAETCGYTVEEMIGMEWTETVAPESLRAAMECYCAMRDHGVAEADIIGIRKDGSRFRKHVALLSLDGDGHYCFMRETLTEEKR